MGSYASSSPLDNVVVDELNLVYSSDNPQDYPHWLLIILYSLNCVFLGKI